MDKRFLFCLFFLYVAAFAIRWPFLSSVDIGSDNIGPALAAMGFLEKGWSEPPNPESDHWLWITSAPWLLMSNSLRDFFIWRFAIGALIAPIAGLTAYLLAPKHKIAAAFIAGMIVALDPGLIDTLVSGFRGYMAPEWIAFGGLLAVVGSQDRPYVFAAALPVLVIAAGHHPLAIGAGLGWFLLAFRLKMNRKAILIGLSLGLVFGLFRLVWMWQLSQCDAGGLACFQTVALGSSESHGIVDILWRALYERFVNELGWGFTLSLIGIFVFRQSPFAYWTFGLLIGVVLLGLFIATLRPYHLRLLAAPIAVVSTIGLLKLGRWGLFISLIWLLSSAYPLFFLEKTPGSLAAHDAMGASFSDLGEGPFWVDAVLVANSSPIYPGAIVLSAWLSGDERRFSSSPYSGRLVFFSSEDNTDGNGFNWTMNAFDSYQTARPWILDNENKGRAIGGGHDWAIQLHSPENVISNFQSQ